jgi:hypothetical protein
MRWFRSNRRPWGWLALLALALQFGLSFGHVHGARGDHPAAVQTTMADAGDASNTGDSSDTDYCATCAILALLTGAQTASASVFVLPVALASAEITLAPDAPRLGASRTAFHSRAPPLS